MAIVAVFHWEQHTHAQLLKVQRLTFRGEPLVGLVNKHRCIPGKSEGRPHRLNTLSARVAPVSLVPKNCV